MGQAADDAPRAVPPFLPVSGDLVLTAASLDVLVSYVALAQTVYATPAPTWMPALPLWRCRIQRLPASLLRTEL
ncbi:hypothetical protein PR003_g32570 [Phytophthora rubi]|uniref:Uncharacterized protein n=1 Tax=Phytophthora rubi TaxID=129364 RepID=A0A6A4B146_9STRA|nr:hypothetical protein PR001_g485 [Phytophthora rubi]KAE9265079.1 hypothetical protein PR003_g32570 [Phytophthora rubi]